MDIYGEALSDFFLKGKADTLWLHNSYDEPEEMPVDIFFREEDEMPVLELIAIENCRGKILDIGAGAGSHALLLQEIGHDITALDNSEAAVKIMEQRGVKKVLLADIFKLENQQYDTLLMLMNGIGITGTLQGFNDFLLQARQWLKPGGQLLFDSSDISYLYQDGVPMPQNKYYGEVSYRYDYKGQKGAWFDWVYLDQNTIRSAAENAGYIAELLFDDEEDQYLFALTMV